MSRQQQDKSRGNSPFSGSMDDLHHFQLLAALSLQSRTPPHASYFDKFKLPHYHLTTAFRLCQPHSPSLDHFPSKKNEISRKHRGNYRKYTVTEKEEAVKQILEGVDAKEISEKYGIPRRNLLRWKKNGCERKEGGGRPTDGEMQLTLYTKIINRMLLTEKDIRAEAKRLSKMVDFKASKGWYCKFSRRYNQWNRQLRQKARVEGHQAEKEVFLLPEVSDQSSSESGSDQASLPNKQQE